MNKKILIGKRIRQWLINNYGSVSDGAKILAISPNALSTNYFSGKSFPGGELLSRLVELGCNMNWLLSEEVTQPMDTEGIIMPNIMSFPVLGTIPAGRADYNPHDWPEYFSLDFNKETHFCLKIDEENGYSMMPVIEPGDVILCNRHSKLIKNGDIVAVRYDEGRAAVKKIIIQEDTKGGPLFLSSSNPSVVPMIIPRKRVNEIYKVVAIFKR